MKVVFRVDASVAMGTGHLMRCLTLAKALAAQGVRCDFICREHAGHLIAQVRDGGYQVHALPAPALESAPALPADGSRPFYSSLLGASQEQDANECLPIVQEIAPDWLIVDHYGLDAQWEKILAPHCRHMLVIDDLADRDHQCDLLLDQTLGRAAATYRSRVPPACRLLCGTQYALLRPEFAALRNDSLKRRRQAEVEQVLITMGGTDQGNATGTVLEALAGLEGLAVGRITVVMGTTAPWLNAVRDQAGTMPWPTVVVTGVNDMAQRMADSDLAIGAAGSTAWERCCLGLPTIMVVLADNQNQVASSLAQAGAARVLPGPQHIATELPALLQRLLESPQQRATMMQAAAGIVDGLGVSRVLQHMRY